MFSISPLKFILYKKGSEGTFNGCNQKVDHTSSIRVETATKTGGGCTRRTLVLPLSHKKDPTDNFTRTNSGILPKRHNILVPLNETYALMYNIKCGQKSLNVHNQVFRQKIEVPPLFCE